MVDSLVRCFMETDCFSVISIQYKMILLNSVSSYSENVVWTQRMMRRMMMMMNPELVQTVKHWCKHVVSDKAATGTGRFKETQSGRKKKAWRKLAEQRDWMQPAVNAPQYAASVCSLPSPRPDFACFTNHWISGVDFETNFQRVKRFIMKLYSTYYNLGFISVIFSIWELAEKLLNREDLLLFLSYVIINWISLLGNCDEHFLFGSDILFIQKIIKTWINNENNPELQPYYTLCDKLLWVKPEIKIFVNRFS